MFTPPSISKNAPMITVLPQVGVAHKRGPLMFEKYHNSKTLSDVIVRYGNSGERTFAGHKLLLASKSRWFEAAFTGNFMEASAPEITLKDDDPEAVEAMFRFIYGHEIRFPTRDPSSANVVFSIGLAQVADKYDLDTFTIEAVGLFGTWVEKFIGGLKEDDASAQDLREIITAVYNFAGDPTEVKTVVHALVDTIFNKPNTSLLGAPGILAKAIAESASQTPDFGRDLFLGLMQRRDLVGLNAGNSRLCFATMFKCPDCKITWTKVQDRMNKEGYCCKCGYWSGDWTKNKA